MKPTPRTKQRPTCWIVLILLSISITGCWLPNLNNHGSKIGTNLAPVSNAGGSFPFFNLMHHASAWQSITTGGYNDDGRNLALDANGWVTALLPNQIARTFIWNDLMPHQTPPAGTYVVTWDGAGAIELRVSPYDPDVGLQVIDSDVGRAEFVVPARTVQLQLDVVEIASHDPIRNLRILLPGGVCEAVDPILQTGPLEQFFRARGPADCPGTKQYRPFASLSNEQLLFNPDFLNQIRNRSVVRTMEWFATNGQADTLWANSASWEQRPTMSTRRWDYYQKGVPIEAPVQLANVLDADLWVTIPHSADDVYVREMAHLLRSRLEPSRKLYVEYSNETWNTIFHQHCWMVRKGNGQDPVAGADNCRDTSPPDDLDFLAGAEYYAIRSSQIFDIFDEVFGDNMHRLNRVLAGQAAGPAWNARILATETAPGMLAGQRADSFAIAPYIRDTWQLGPASTHVIHGTTVHCDGTDNPVAPPGLLLDTPGDSHLPDTDDNNPVLLDAAVDPVNVQLHADLIFDSMVSEALCYVDIAGLLIAPFDESSVQGDEVGLELIAYEGGQHLVGVAGQQYTPFHGMVTARYRALNQHPRMGDIYTAFLTKWQEKGGGLFAHFASPSGWSGFGNFGVSEGTYAPDVPKSVSVDEFIQDQRSH